MAVVVEPGRPWGRRSGGTTRLSAPTR